MNFIKLSFLKYIFWGASIGIIFQSCGNSSEEAEKQEEPKTPVELTSINIEAISESIELNAVSMCKKNIIRANAAGLISKVEINLGDNVAAGQLVFGIKTKEASALEKSTVGDSSLLFQGLIKVIAPKAGIVSNISHQKGDYIQEGDELAIVSEKNSLQFLLEVPFENRKYVFLNKDCEIVLPDNTVIKGSISSLLPTMDSQSQTENYIIKPATTEKLPENLVVRVRIVKNVKSKAIVLPKQAILTNEIQTEFWIMKLLNDTIAVKVPVKKGIESFDRVEILEPTFEKTDRIILTGNYGLADTALVSIKKN
jgi:multidrug efflux pump subunit AcrA (membrane-fusion protein)